MFGKHKNARKAPQLIEGYKVYPTATRLIKRQCNNARLAGLLRDEHDYAIAAAALLAAGMNVATDRGQRRVQIPHIKEGWETKLRIMECPVEICIFRSAVQKVELLRESMPHFSEVHYMLTSDK